MTTSPAVSVRLGNELHPDQHQKRRENGAQDGFRDASTEKATEIDAWNGAYEKGSEQLPINVAHV